MSDDSATKRALMRYVDAATDLAESVKKNIAHDGIIDDKTVILLNEFIIAANAIADLTTALNQTNIKYN